MTKEELLTLANEMGITVIHGIIKHRTEAIEAFAALVAEKERDEIERLRRVCRDAYEVWAGSEGVPLPKTAAEAYVLQLLTQMRDEVKKGLRNEHG